MSWLVREDPDVVFLFESSVEWEDAAIDAVLGLAFIAVVPRERLSGVTVLARSELAARVIETPFDPAEGIGIEVTTGGERVSVLGLHPPSPTSASRAEARDRLLAEGGDWMADRDGAAMLVGDLNATPWSHAFRDLLRRGDLTDSLRGRGLQPTWPEGAGPFMIPIDHALVGDGLVVVDRRTGPANGSEHRPLVVEAAVTG